MDDLRVKIKGFTTYRYNFHPSTKGGDEGERNQKKEMGRSGYTTLGRELFRLRFYLSGIFILINSKTGI